MSDSGHVIGEDNPYHDNFSGSFKAELAKRDAENAALRERLAEAEREREHMRLEMVQWTTQPNPLINDLRHQLAALRAKLAAAEKRAEAAEATLRTCCENEEAARTIAAMLIGGSQTEGDNYCVPSIADLMVMVVGRAEAAEVKVWELEEERDLLRSERNARQATVEILRTENVNLRNGHQPFASESLRFHAFAQGVEMGLLGFDHRSDCPYETLAYRCWWMHGCITGQHKRQLALAADEEAAAGDEARKEVTALQAKLAAVRERLRAEFIYADEETGKLKVAFLGADSEKNELLAIYELVAESVKE